MSNVRPMKQAHDYAHLWQHPQDGWVLLRVHRQGLSLTLVFNADGPSLKDIAAVRASVPEYGDMPLSEAFASLKRKGSVSLGTFAAREGKRLAEKCRGQSLHVEESVVDKLSYMPFNERTREALVIEDDVLAEQVCQAALLNGIRVAHVEA